MQEKQIWSLSQKDPFRRKWQPPPVFLPGKSIGQRRLVSYSPWVAKSQTRLSMQALAPGPSLQIILRRGKTLQSHPPNLMGLTSCLQSHCEFLYSWSSFSADLINTLVFQGVLLKKIYMHMYTYLCTYWFSIYNNSLNWKFMPWALFCMYAIHQIKKLKNLKKKNKNFL